MYLSLSYDKIARKLDLNQCQEAQSQLLCIHSQLCVCTSMEVKRVLLTPFPRREAVRRRSVCISICVAVAKLIAQIS